MKLQSWLLVRTVSFFFVLLQVMSRQKIGDVMFGWVTTRFEWTWSTPLFTSFSSHYALTPPELLTWCSYRLLSASISLSLVPAPLLSCHRDVYTWVNEKKRIEDECFVVRLFRESSKLQNLRLLDDETHPGDAWASRGSTQWVTLVQQGWNKCSQNWVNTGVYETLRYLDI